jgi:hypothetical protein
VLLPQTPFGASSGVLLLATTRRQVSCGVLLSQTPLKTSSSVLLFAKTPKMKGGVLLSLLYVIRGFAPQRKEKEMKEKLGTTTMSLPPKKSWEWFQEKQM